MKNYKSSLLIILATILVAAAGSYFTNLGMNWYDTSITRPSFTPPDIAFPIAWTTIFILTAISAIIIFNKNRKLLWLYAINGFLNILWCLLFFALQEIRLALIEMIILEILTLIMIITTWKHSKPASLMLLPYLLWVGLATYLTYSILILNS